MLRKWIWIIAIFISTLSLLGCRSYSVVETPAVTVAADTTMTPSQSLSPTPIPPKLPNKINLDTPVASPQLGSTVGRPFLPGDILAGLPVYPGAEPTTYSYPGFGPPSFPMDQGSYFGKAPGYQSASAQYTVQAAAEDIMGWYLAELGAKGYQHSGEEMGGNANIIRRSTAFFLPSQPLVSVQVHIYTWPSSSDRAVFELLVIYTVPLPKPPGETLPDDIDNVEIYHDPGTANETKNTIRDIQTISKLVNMVNGLPARPDYITLGGPIGAPQTVFRLIFHSKTKGDITIDTDIFGAVRINDFPPLDDLHKLFDSELRQVIGIPGTVN